MRMLRFDAPGSGRERPAARAAALVLAAAVAAAGCGTGQGEADRADAAVDRAAGSSAAPPAAPATFHATAPGPDHLTLLPTWDVGTGLVRIAPSPDGPPGSAPADTFPIRASPGEAAPLVARAFHRDYRLVIEATEPGLRDGAVEVGYEERALPGLRTGEDGRWVEVAYAFTPDGAPRTGWVDLTTAAFDTASWRRWLVALDYPLFFRHPDSTAFFDRPGGQPLDLVLSPGDPGEGPDYILYPARPEGDWLQVRVVSPSDYCETPAGPTAGERAWIRYVTPGGRPRVWYFTRGC